MDVSTSLEVPFLGARSYLQGPSILESIQKYHGPSSNFIFKVRAQFTSNTIDVTTMHRNGAMPGAEYHWRKDKSEGCLYIYPNVANDNEKRIEFNESLITNKSIIKNEAVSLMIDPKLGLATQIVSLNKHLLLNTWPMIKPGRWVFMAMQMREDHNSDKILSVAIEKKVPASLMARSLIRSGERNIGTLDFVWR